MYTGVLRTNPNTLTASVPVRGRPCRVAAEYFAVMADAYVLLGRLGAADYTCSTPDGRDTSPAACAERLARLVCADREMLSEPEIVKLARYLVECQLQVVSEGLLQVVSRWDGPPTRPSPRPASAPSWRPRSPAVWARAVLPAGSIWGDEGVALPAVAAACCWPRARRSRGRDRRRHQGGRQPGPRDLPAGAWARASPSLAAAIDCWWCRAAASSPTR